MDKKTFLEILMTSTPEEINDIIETRGKDHKMVNLISFIPPEEKEDNE